MFFLLLSGGKVYPHPIADNLFANSKTVKWTSLSGKNNEFIFYIPENYLSVSKSDYYLGGSLNNLGAHVNTELKVARYVNGVVLMMNYYEGDAKEIQKSIIDSEKLSLTATQDVNGFQEKTFSEAKNKLYSKIQHFQIKNRLYIVKSISSSENNEIVQAFFESIRLVNNKITTTPNALKDVKSAALPVLTEPDLQMSEDAEPIAEKDADRKVIILNFSGLKFPLNSAGHLSSGKIKVKILYSSTGKVTNVEVIESSAKELEKIAIESMKNTVFIPAEKDGKLVSVYKIQEYQFGSSTSIRRL